MIPRSLLVLTIVLFSGFNFQSGTRANIWVIQKNCFLKVSGKTNVNSFNCVINSYAKPDTLTYFGSSTGSLKLSGSVQLDIRDFDCYDQMMTKDLRKTLKYKEYPKMIIHFISLKRYPKFREKPDAITGFVAIELAGITKQFEVNYLFRSDGPAAATLVGTRKINFSDFNLDPPRKLGGVIRAGNELNVEFDLKFRIVD